MTKVSIRLLPDTEQASFVVLAEDYIKTYVLNVGTSELLFSMVRSGSSSHPNAIKTQRGACKPAGSLVR